MSAKHTAASSRPKSSKSSRPTRGRADLARLRQASDATIARTSPPELADLPADFWDDAVAVEPIAKTPISLRVDDDVLQWFRQAGPRYQSRMNAVLRAYMEHARGRVAARTRTSALPRKPIK